MTDIIPALFLPTSVDTLCDGCYSCADHCCCRAALAACGHVGTWETACEFPANHSGEHAGMDRSGEWRRWA